MNIMKPVIAASFILTGVLGGFVGAANAAQPEVVSNYSPDTKKVGGYTVQHCQINQSENALDFCGKRAIAAYKRLGTSDNINFNGKYVLIGFKGQSPVSKYMQYAAVNPVTKTVYPFDFIVYSDDPTKFEQVEISSKKSTLCADEVAKFRGDRMLKAYGGFPVERGDSSICFSFSEKSGFGFAPSS
ncbi:hypothetical protein ACTXIV_12100 [Psychrobacter celer]|uniref:hypothetical protein n=1 Tax=Psychrobacter celer TaxID=306572 RepID=UPI003FD5E240